MNEQGKKLEELVAAIESVDAPGREQIEAVEKAAVAEGPAGIAPEVVEEPFEDVVTVSEIPASPVENAGRHEEVQQVEASRVPTSRKNEEKLQKQSEDIRQVISKATLPEKIKLGMFGNSTCRALLIRDANRMIQEFVLKNPRIQVRELEEFAKNPQISQHVLRRIQDNNMWMKSYTLKFNLVSNSKTPQDISLKWLKFINMYDLKRLARSKNIPQVVAVMARKKVNEAEHKG